jgi:hypothetical protein
VPPDILYIIWESHPGSCRRVVGDGCTAHPCQPGLLLVTELAPVADAGAGDHGICNGPLVRTHAAQ